MNRISTLMMGLAIACLATAPVWAVDRTIQRTFQLQPGAEVEISGINGRVEIETGAGGQAVVTIQRQAQTEGDLEDRPVILEQSRNRLVLRVENHGSSRSVRDEVSLRLPVKVKRLAISGVNGTVKSGFIEGQSRVEGVNGPVTLVQAGGELELLGINGAVDVEMGAPRKRGARLEGINGSIRLRVPEGSSFDVVASSKNGRVEIDLADVNVEVNERDHFRARVGRGGPAIHLDGINGKIEITR